MKFNKRQTFQLGVVLSIALHLVFSGLFTYLINDHEKTPLPTIVKLGVSLGRDTSHPTPQTPIQETSESPLSARPTKLESHPKPTSSRDEKPKTKEPNKPLSGDLSSAVIATASAPPSNIARGKAPPEKQEQQTNQQPESETLKEPERVTETTTLSRDNTPNANSTQTKQKTINANDTTNHLAAETSNITAPKFTLGSLNNPRPKYPTLARNRGWEGDVIIGVHVNSDGSIKNLEILKGAHYSPLNYAAWQTVKTQWTFTPAHRNGEPITAFVEVPISFRLSDTH